MKHAFLLLLALVAPALCLSRTSAQAPPSPPLTGKIAHITILGTKNIPIDTVRAVLALKPGDAYTPDAAAKDMAAIKGMGVFNSVTEAETADPAGGVNVAYTVVENPVVTDIKFTANTPNGLPSIPTRELIARMKTRVGQVLNKDVLISDLNSLCDRNIGYFTQQGYLLADASVSINIDPSGVITIPFVECHVQSIQIAGNSRVKTADIFAQMHTKFGDIYNADTLNIDYSSIFEMGSFREVNYKWTIVGTGQIGVTISVVEQAPATGRLDEKQGKVIPFVYDPLTNPFPIIRVSVNGKPPLPFIVDTGSSPALLLNPWAAKDIGIKVSSAVEKNDVNIAFKRVVVQSAVLQGENNSNVTVDPREAAVLDLSLLSQFSSGQHIAGIVGLGALLPVTSRFDFAARTLTIFSAPHPPLHISEGTLLPLHGNTGGIFLVRATLAPDTYADLILDTGSDSTQLPLSALDTLHPTAASYDSFYGRLDATYICPTLRLPKLDLGALSVPDVVVGTLPPPTQSLGLDILAGYLMTLDGPNAQLILEPSAHSRRYVTGWSGVDIKQANQGWKVTALRGNSPARLAGLRVGDLIVAANGVRFDGLTESQAKYILGGIFGQPLKVIIKRGDSQRRSVSVSWTPLDEFSAPTDPTNGLALEKAPNGPWVVKEILHGCSGDLAGLQVGDAIIQVQGEAVAEMPINRYGDLVRQPVVVLEVERVGVAKPFTVRLSVPK